MLRTCYCETYNDGFVWCIVALCFILRYWVVELRLSTLFPYVVKACGGLNSVSLGNWVHEKI